MFRKTVYVHQYKVTKLLIKIKITNNISNRILKGLFNETQFDWSNNLFFIIPLIFARVSHLFFDFDNWTVCGSSNSNCLLNVKLSSLIVYKLQVCDNRRTDSVYKGSIFYHFAQRTLKFIHNHISIKFYQ